MEDGVIDFEILPANIKEIVSVELKKESLV